MNINCSNIHYMLYRPFKQFHYEICYMNNYMLYFRDYSILLAVSLLRNSCSDNNIGIVINILILKALFSKICIKLESYTKYVSNTVEPGYAEPLKCGQSIIRNFSIGYNLHSHCKPYILTSEKRTPCYSAKLNSQ